MAESVVTSPDGRKFKVTHPEGASQADIITYAQTQMANERRPETPLGTKAYSDRDTGDVVLSGFPRGFTFGFDNDIKAALAATFRDDVPGKTWAERYQRSLDAFDEQKRSDRKNRPVAAYGSEAAGSVAATLPVAAAMPAAATGGARILQGAEIGAGTGALSGLGEGRGGAEGRLTEAAERGATGAVVGALVPAVWEGAKAGGRVVRNLVQPLTPEGANSAAGRLANEVVGKDGRERVIQALQQSRGLVPGSQPTAGQAAVPAGSAEFSGLQRIVEKHDPSRYAAIDAAQEGARRTAIHNIGQDKATLAAAEQARGATAAMNYGAAYRQAVRADADLLALADNPYVKKALATAEDLAKARGINPRDNLTEFVHLVKIGLDKQVQKVGEGALHETEKRTVEAAKNQLLAWLKAKNPLYDKARAEFARYSVPVNQMQVGQYLEGKLVAPLEATERAASFAQAVKDAPGTIRRAAGGPRYDDLGQVMSPGQMNVVNAIVGDLQRDAAHNRLATAGIESARKRLGLATDIPTPNLLDRGVLIVNTIVRRMKGQAGERSMNALAEAMADPREMARIMQAATPRERSELVDLMTRLGAGAAGAEFKP